MDIYEYLKLDHQQVSQLFKQFEKAELPERKKQIIDLLIEELTVHAESEEETFYKKLQQFEDTSEEADHGQEEHNEIKDQIKAIQESKRLDAAWVKKVEHLQELVNHHVKEEEGPMFRKAKSVLTDDEAYMIKEQMHYLKQHLLLSLKQKAVQEK